MNRIHIKLQSAPIHQLKECEEALNDWANRRLHDGCRIRDLSLKLNGTDVVVLAVADGPEACPQSANAGNRQSSASDPQPDDVTPDLEQDPLERLFQNQAEEPPPPERRAETHPLFDQPLFQHAATEDQPGHEDPPAEDLLGTPWQLSSRSSTWWRRYDQTGTGQVGPKQQGRPGYWWRIIGPGGNPIARGDAHSVEEGKDACDRQMKSPTPAGPAAHRHEPASPTHPAGSFPARRTTAVIRDDFEIKTTAGNS